MLARACLPLTLLLAAELHSEMEVDDAAPAALETPGELPSLLPVAGCTGTAISHFCFVAGSVDSCASAPGRPGAAEAHHAPAPKTPGEPAFSSDPCRFFRALLFVVGSLDSCASATPGVQVRCAADGCGAGFCLAGLCLLHFDVCCLAASFALCPPAVCALLVSVVSLLPRSASRGLGRFRVIESPVCGLIIMVS